MEIAPFTAWGCCPLQLAPPDGMQCSQCSLIHLYLTNAQPCSAVLQVLPQEPPGHHVHVIPSLYSSVCNTHSLH